MSKAQARQQMEELMKTIRDDSEKRTASQWFDGQSEEEQQQILAILYKQGDLKPSIKMEGPVPISDDEEHKEGIEGLDQDEIRGVSGAGALDVTAYRHQSISSNVGYLPGTESLLKREKQER